MNDYAKELLSMSGKISIDNDHLKEIVSLGGSINNGHGGLQVVFKECDFVCHWWSYGGPDLLWEIMPDPEILEGVKGYLTIDQAIEAVKEIKRKRGQQ